MAFTELSLIVLVQGLAAGAVASILRTWSGTLAGPAFSAWWEAQKQLKPLGCPVCMGFWCALGVSGGLTNWALAKPLAPVPFILTLLASAGVAAWVNSQVIPPTLSALPLDDLTRDKEGV